MTPEETKHKERLAERIIELLAENAKLVTRCGEIGVERDVALGENAELKETIQQLGRCECGEPLPRWCKKCRKRWAS